MVAPGVQIVSRAAPTSRGGPVPTGRWHVAAFAERGPVDSPRLLRNLGDYDRHYGGRESYTQRDAIEAYFRNGGSEVNFIRIVGPAATTATVAATGAAAAPSLAIDGAGPGPVTLKAGVEVLTDGRFVVSVYDASDVRLEQSPPLDSTAAAVTWSSKSPYIRIRALGTALPIAKAATAIAGGADDRAAVTDVHRLEALNRIPKSDGPGQVSVPGATTADIHAGLEAHAKTNNRFAIKDAPNTTVEADLTTAAGADRAASTPENQSYGFLVEGWHYIEGLLPGTTRIVPPSAIVAALMARRDALTRNPNDPAAGVNGVPSYSLGVARPNWSDDARDRLNAAGVNVFRLKGGEQRLYGYRTSVDPYGTHGAWLSASNARLRMAIQHQADEIAEAFVFSQITNAKIAEFNGALTGMLLGWYNLGALFGDTPPEAFSVDTGPAVNTLERIAARQLSAVMGARMSEFAETVYMEFVKIPVTEAIA